MEHHYITAVHRNLTPRFLSPSHCLRRPGLAVTVDVTAQKVIKRVPVRTLRRKIFRRRETESDTTTNGAHKCSVKSLLSITTGTEKRKQTVEKMGSEGNFERKPRFLCLHGFRTSAEILKTQLGKWPQTVLQKIDLVFADAPFPAQGKSDVDGIFDPPYYEWFQFNKDFTEYINFEESLAYIEDCMIKHGPIDGLLGFSQGAILSAALPGLQAKGLALTKVPKIKFLIIVGGAKLKNPSLAEKAYPPPTQLTSVHFLGETDFLKQYGIELIESFVDPLVIHHPKGHTIPRLDEKTSEMMMSFLERIQKVVTGNEEQEISFLE